MNKIRKNVGIIIAVLIIIAVAILMSYNQKEISPTIKSGKKILLDAAWIIHKMGGGDKIFQGQEILKNVTDNVSNIDERYIKLFEKNVPTDTVDEESLYASFKAEDLPGYYIFTMAPGDTLGFATGEIDVNYIGMRKDNDTLFLDLRYKSNKAFHIDILYSKNPGIHNVPAVWPDNEIHNRSVFNAYPADFSSIYTNAESTLPWSWKYISFKLDNLKSESKRIDTAQTFLEEELDKNLQNKDMSKFVWDDQKFTKENISKVVNESKKRGYDTIGILTHKVELDGSMEIEAGEFGGPSISQDVVICGSTWVACYDNKIMISVK
jgi:hypothetical protein